MAAASVSVDGSGEDCCFVWWEPRAMRVADLRRALSNHGMVDLAPKASTIPAAMKEMMSGFIEASNLKVRGMPIEINPLRHDVKGFDAVRRFPGDVTNRFEHLISVLFDEGTNRIRIVSHNKAYFSFGGNESIIENKMTEVFFQQLDWYPASMVSNCVSRVAQHMGGTLCRKAGGVWFLPQLAVNRFEPLADELEGCEGGVTITITKFDLKPGERSYRLVAESIKSEINEALTQMEDTLKNIGRQRSNGVASRTTALEEMAEKIKRYESILGQPLNDLRSAVAKVQAAVDANAAIDLCL